MSKIVNLIVWAWVVMSYPFHVDDWKNEFLRRTETTCGTLVGRSFTMSIVSLVLLILGLIIGSGDWRYGIPFLCLAILIYVCGAAVFLQAILPHAQKGPFPEQNQKD